MIIFTHVNLFFMLNPNMVMEILKFVGKSIKKSDLSVSPGPKPLKE